MRQVEILAPAGSLEGLYGALDMGADAVYVGTSRFGARAFADNPGVEELKKALVYAHLRGKKIYLTVNTLLNDRELEDELLPLIRPLYESGLDACIVQDLGVLDCLHENFPDMDFHASTQMTLFSGEEAELLKPFGITRYVPARELTIEEIREARRQTDLEIEVFVHGALCYCYSGQCMMSETIGGRSGNRGMCAQPCRLAFDTPYGKGHFLNTKDSCTLTEIPEMIEAGIDSFKIEGRMKKKEYGAGLAYLYRKYADYYFEFGRDRFEELRGNRESELWRDYRSCMELYNRGGFSKSFLFEKDKSGMVYPVKNNHFGIPVGSVVRAGKRTAEFITSEELNYQDVLEFRDERGNSCYEYTVKNPVGKGQQVVTNILSGSKIFMGQSVYRIRNEKLLNEIDERIRRAKRDFSLAGRLTAEQGKPVRLTIWADRRDMTEKVVGETAERIEKTVEGALVQRAEARPVTEEDVRKRLDSLGNMPYRWGSLTIELEENSFLPLGSLKKLRREGIEAWERVAMPGRTAGQRCRETERAEMSEDERKSDSETRSDGEIRLDSERKSSQEGKSGIESKSGRERKSDSETKMVSVAKCSQFQTVLREIGDMENLLIHIKLEDIPPQNWGNIREILEEYEDGTQIAISLPRILHGESRKQFERDWAEYGAVFRDSGGHKVSEKDSVIPVSAVVLDSAYAILHAKKYFPDAVWIAGEHFYQENERARKVFLRYNILPSFERKYGRIPVMVSKSCVACTLGFCPKVQHSKNKKQNRDEKKNMETIPIVTPKGDEFFVEKHCRYCYNTIYTKMPIQNKGGNWIDFTCERKEEIKSVLNNYM